MIEQRAYRVERPFQKAEGEVIFGTRMETDGDFAKIYDGDTLVFLQRGFGGSLKDIGSKDSCAQTQKMIWGCRSTLLKSAASMMR
jgi:hypothetical protein